MIKNLRTADNPCLKINQFPQAKLKALDLS